MVVLKPIKHYLNKNNQIVTRLIVPTINHIPAPKIQLNRMSHLFLEPNV